MLAKVMVVLSNDQDTNILTRIDGLNTFEIPYFIDNLKWDTDSETTWGGTGYNFIGMIAAESQRKKETWSTPPTLEDTNWGGAVEMKMEDGIMWYRNHVISNKINGWSNAVKIQNTLVMGSWIDENFLLCPYDEDKATAWTRMPTPSSVSPWKLMALMVAPFWILFFYR
jgi:hypothetical protein